MQQWDTIDRPVSEQYSYWREVVCEAFTPLRPTARGASDSWRASGLDGRVATRGFGGVNGAEISTCEQTIHHGPAEVGRVREEVVFVNLMLSGRCVVSQGDDRSMSGPGTFSIVDAARPFSLDYVDRWRAISFRLPTSEVSGAKQIPLARSFSSGRGMGAVLADTLRAAWAGASDLTEAEAAATGRAVAALVGALDSRGTGGGMAASREGDEALRRSIEKHVSDHLRYVDTSPSAIARHFAISVRTLHKLYEDAPLTFGQTVMRLRVQRCADDLIAAEGRWTVTQLAAKWGFSDLSHLNRSFRHHLGASARDYAASRG